MAGCEPCEEALGGRLRLVGQDSRGRGGDVGAQVKGQQAEQFLLLHGQALQGLVEHGPQTAFTVVQAVQNAFRTAQGIGTFGQRLLRVLGQQSSRDLQGQREKAAR
ncbi:hypothetical protein ACWGHQ_08650 [Streptomyces griseus]